MVITRRKVLQGLAAFTAGGFGLTSYAFGIEPLVRLRVTRYSITPVGWPRGLRLSIALLADLHACDPWMPEDRIAGIVARTNALNPDLVFLLGDYVAAHRFLKRKLPPDVWSAPLARLEAPLGVHSILGNHDWWDDAAAQARRRGPVAAGLALEAAGIPVYENRAVRLVKDGHGFWVAGLSDQLALFTRGQGYRRKTGGLDDLPGTLAQVTDESPVLLMAHEPDIFPEVPPRVALTFSGHTHGGQVRLLGYSPVVPSLYGNRYAYGHIVEDKRNLVVSGGLGCSIAPLRFGVPPEIVLVEVGGDGPLV